MVEVFKTNIEDPLRAKWLVSKIDETFSSYKANFDLDDCDNILRVECVEGIKPNQLISFLAKYNCIAEVLDDEITPYRASNKILKELVVISK